jgi:hypothetical protein
MKLGAGTSNKTLMFYDAQRPRSGAARARRARDVAWSALLGVTKRVLFIDWNA